MSAREDERLAYMANQIARNLALDDDPASAVAAHIHAFWSPRMVVGLLRQPDGALDPIAAQAVARLGVKVATTSG